MGVSPITSLLHDRICGIRVQSTHGRILNILSIYMPAPGSEDDFDIVLDDLSDFVENMETGSLTILCGDFNGDVGYLVGKKSTRRPTPLGRKLMNFFNEYSLTSEGGVGASTIDYIAVPYGLQDDILSCEVLVNPILNTSDHFETRLP